MDGQASASPVTDNSQAQGVAAEGSGSFLDGLIGQTAAGGTETAGSANQSEGNSGQAPAAGQEGAPSAQPDQPQASRPAWMKQLQADLQAHDGLSRFPTITELGKSYLELEGKLGNSVAIPGKDATQEQWAQFYQRVGRPKTKDDYTLEKPKDLPADLPYNEEGEAGFKAMAFELGLTQQQATALFNRTFKSVIEAHKATQEARASKAKEIKQAEERQRQECEASLKEKYGAKYEAQVENGRRVIQAYGNPNVVKAIKESGLSSNAAFMDFLFSVGAELREDTLIGPAASTPPAAGKGFDYPGL